MNSKLAINENSVNALDLSNVIEQLEDVLILVDEVLNDDYPVISDEFNAYQMTDKEFLELIYQRLRFSYSDLKEIHYKLTNLTGGNEHTTH